MTLSPLPLSYCTNVHPGRTVGEVIAGLVSHTAPAQREAGFPIAAGLWLSQPVVSEILEDASGAKFARLSETLARQGLCCYTLNAFPFGDFHGERVKEQVYLPDWSDPRRGEYTVHCARLLSALLPDLVEGSVSTLPLGFKQLPQAPDFEQRAIEQLISVAVQLHELHRLTGKCIRLAIEPEPFCLLETTEETIEFFGRLFDAATREGCLALVREHVGVCFDVCHQAVEFENMADSLAALESAAIRINKVHLTCALELADPECNTTGRGELAQFVEPRYLHQILAREASGRILRQVDLTSELALDPPTEFRAAKAWRIHFHVPVDAERIGSLRTTREELREALRGVAKLGYAPHLEVETYTWSVFRGKQEQTLSSGIARELRATRELIEVTARS